MIDIFGMKDDHDFFKDLTLTKHQEDKIREVVFILNLFPSILDSMELTNAEGALPIRRQLMAQLIE
jgi:hypothetical protein